MSNAKPQKSKASRPPRVVILGSGYAGVNAARELLANTMEDEIEVVMLSATDHFLYLTMVYEVAAGNLPASSIRQSVRTLFAEDGLHFVQGEATEVDFDNQTIQFRSGSGETDNPRPNRQLAMEYDYLISSIGSETNFFGTPGAKRYAETLKTLPDAKRIKNRVISNFEQAVLETDEAKIKELLRFTVVGGGPTGVTLSAKIADLLDEEITSSFPKLSQYAEVVVIEGMDRLVKPAGEWFSARVSKALKDRQNIRVILNTFVDRVRPDGVEFDEDFLRSDTVIWTAGVKAREFATIAKKGIKKHENSGRIHVTPQLHTQTYPNVYVAGDQAWVERIDTDQPYPMRAQFAVRQGRQAAKNVLANVRGNSEAPFHWNDKGIVISAGHGRTYAEVLGVKLSGLPATIVYKLVYLNSMIGFRQRARAILEWTLNMFFPRDISEL